MKTGEAAKPDDSKMDEDAEVDEKESKHCFFNVKIFLAFMCVFTITQGQ